MSDQTALTQLLDQVTAILELRSKRPPVPGEMFNVFSVMNMETKEVDTHCRLLYDLLSPNGSHGMGSCFLRAFFEIVLGKSYPGDAAVSVYREFVIDRNDDNYGRIDLLIRGPGFCYPIEVKVRAGDQWEQVKRYARFSSDARDSQVYYLTLQGASPSEDSLGGVDVSDIICLSFAQDIKNWMKRCGELAWNVPNVAEIIRQYIRLLNKLTGAQEGDAFMDQIKKTIGMSQVNFKSAFAISQAVPALQIKTMEDFFRDIEAHMGQMKPPIKKLHSDYEKKAVSYYQNTRGGAYPSLTYQLTEYNSYTLALRFEIGSNFYWGLALFKDGQQIQWSNDLGKLTEAFSEQHWQTHISTSKPMTRWFLWWRYLPSGDIDPIQELMINFRDCMNSRYTELFDPDKHEKLMGEIFDQIDQHIEKIRQTGLYE